MDYFSVLYEEKERELPLEDIVLRVEKIDKYDIKLLRKLMIRTMAKVKYDKRIGIKYSYKETGVKTIFYIK
ncbi:TPA: hypothetical protein ACGX4V_002270 [Enterococcus faecalis]